MKSINIKSLFLLVCLSCALSSRLIKSGVLDPNISADASSLASSTDNIVTTKSEANAEATRGYTAVGAAASVAKSDNLSTSSAVTAVADASLSDKLKQATASQETTSTYSTGQTGQAYEELVNSDSYKTAQTKTTSLDDSVSIAKSDQFQVSEDKKLVNDFATITENTVQTSTTDTLTNELGVLSQEKKSDIVITIDTSAEKIIIERIIGNEQRVIIVSAAKFLKSSLGVSDAANIKQLLTESCNCRKAKDYLIEMLAEA